MISRQTGRPSEREDRRFEMPGGVIKRGAIAILVLTIGVGAIVYVRESARVSAAREWAPSGCVVYGQPGKGLKVLNLQTWQREDLTLPGEIDSTLIRMLNTAPGRVFRLALLWGWPARADVVDVETGQLARLGEMAGPVSLSPDGKFALGLATNYSHLQLIDLGTGERTPLDITVSGADGEYAWLTPDKFAVFNSRGVLYVYTLSTRTARKLADKGMNVVAAGPNRVAYLSLEKDDAIIMKDVRSGRELWRREWKEQYPAAAASDGRYLFVYQTRHWFFTEHSDLVLLDIETGREAVLVQGVGPSGIGYGKCGYRE